MSILHWLMPWRRDLRPDKPFQPVGEVHEAVRQSHVLQDTASRTISTSIDAIERQQNSGLMRRLAQRADDLRSLTNETIDRTR